MAMIPRSIQPAIEQALFQGKVIILYGARQVGKTTLIRAIQSNYSGEGLYLNCDEPDVRLALSERTSTELRLLVGNKKLVLIDEAQRVRNIGLTLKLMADNFPDIQVVATGSSSFDLSNDISEPLTGRKIEFFLYPLSIGELLSRTTPLELNRSLEHYLRYGLYPDVVLGDQPAALISEIAKSYLYKDILEYQVVKNPDLLHRLLQALALQIGNEVSYNELGGLLGLDRDTIRRYVSLLERGFVIFHLPPFSRNLRKELGKNRKIYFYDLGVRNALLNNFNPLELRLDAGGLWENFFISERIKALHNQQRYPNTYFWRTYDGKEIDYLEEAGQLTGFECKISSDKWRPPPDFIQAYPGSQVHLISRKSYLQFLADE